MTTPMFPYAIWASGTTQNSIPANDNSLRNEIVNRAAKGIANSAPSSPADGDVYIVGAAWGTFATNDVALYRSGTWYGYAPFEGWLKWVTEDAFYKYDPAAGWEAQTFGGAVAAADVSYDNTLSGAGADTVQEALDVLYLIEPEKNAAANVGSGSGVFKARNGSTLEFKSLVAGTGVTLTAGTNSITIDADGGGGAGVPVNSQSGDYTLVLADANSGVYRPPSDTTARTWTIPSNASVAFPVGTAVTFDNDSATGSVTIAITSDTLVRVGSGATGSVTLAPNSQATAWKVGATRWRINVGS